jgi:integration host factor subunit beta
VIKSQLMLNLAAQNPHLFQRDVQKVVDAILEEIVAALVRGDRVELRGFGTFAVKVREGRIGRNPRSGATVRVPQKRIPYFRPGAPIQKRLNPDGAEPQETRT